MGSPQCPSGVGKPGIPGLWPRPTTFISLYLCAEHLDLPSDGDTATESCLASLLLLFHISPFAGASALLQNKRLGGCRSPFPSPQPLPALAFREALPPSPSSLPGCRSSSRTGRDTERQAKALGELEQHQGSEESSSKSNIKASETGRELGMTDLV